MLVKYKCIIQYYKHNIYSSTLELTNLEIKGLNEVQAKKTFKPIPAGFLLTRLALLSQ